MAGGRSFAASAAPAPLPRAILRPSQDIGATGRSLVGQRLRPPFEAVRSVALVQPLVTGSWCDSSPWRDVVKWAGAGSAEVVSASTERLSTPSASASQLLRLTPLAENSQLVCPTVDVLGVEEARRTQHAGNVPKVLGRPPRRGSRRVSSEPRPQRWRKEPGPPNPSTGAARARSGSR